MLSKIMCPFFNSQLPYNLHLLTITPLHLPCLCDPRLPLKTSSSIPSIFLFLQVPLILSWPSSPAHHCTACSIFHINKEKNGFQLVERVYLKKLISSVQQKGSRLQSNIVGPAGHSTGQQKHWSALHHRAEAQSVSNPPTPYNICLNLTQAALITHSAWARDRQHQEICGWDLYSNRMWAWCDTLSTAKTKPPSKGV